MNNSLYLDPQKIKSLQQLMLNKHYYVGMTDGIYGHQTQKAVMLYQQELQKKGLYHGNIDGIWGNQTESAYQKDKKGLSFNNFSSIISNPQKQKIVPWTPAKNDSKKHPSQPKKYPDHPLAKKLVCNGGNAGTGECAQYRNQILRKNGYNLWGNAWQEGGTPVFNGYDHIKITKPTVYNRSEIAKYNEAASEAVYKLFDSKTLNPSKVYTVNMYYRGSPAQQEAFRDGENNMTGTHTGILIYKNGDWYVNHNIHGVVHEDKFTSLQGKNTHTRYGVTAISDPSQVASRKFGGTLSRPYVIYFR